MQLLFCLKWSCPTSHQFDQSDMIRLHPHSSNKVNYLFLAMLVQWLSGWQCLSIGWSTSLLEADISMPVLNHQIYLTCALIFYWFCTSNQLTWRAWGFMVAAAISHQGAIQMFQLQGAVMWSIFIQSMMWTIIEWIDVIFWTDVHAPLWINCHKFCDPLCFPLAPPSGQTLSWLWFMINFFKNCLSLQPLLYYVLSDD